MGTWWSDLWTGLARDFSDLPSLAGLVQILIRLMMAACLGGLLGYNRQQVGKAAGMRTHMLVALGSAFFVLAPQQAGMELDGLSRVTQGVVSGIGFLGAGTILKLSDQQKIKGLTTAASIWLVAAVGVACGMGRLSSAIVVTLLAFVILANLQRFEHWLAGKKEVPPSQTPGPEDECA
jgi:putative Mg2+ transporter-C (MgtC) family protein